MAETKIATVYTDVEARLTKLDQGLRAAEQKVKASAQKMEKESAFSVGGEGVGKAIRFGAAIGAVRSAFDITTAAIQIFRGNMDEAVQSLERLPFGIGAAVGSFKDLLGELTGINAEIAKIQQADAKARSDIDRQMSDTKEGKGIISKIRRANALAGSSNPAELQLVLDFEDARKEAERLGGAIGRAIMDAATEAGRIGASKLQSEALAKKQEAGLREMREQAQAMEKQNKDELDFQFDLAMKQGLANKSAIKVAVDFALAELDEEFNARPPGMQSGSATNLGLNLPSLGRADTPKAKQIDKTNSLLAEIKGQLSRDQRVAIAG